MSERVEFQTQGEKKVFMSVTEDGSVMLTIKNDEYENLYIAAKICGENFIDNIDEILRRL